MVQGNDFWTLLDMGAVTDILSLGFVKILSLDASYTSREMIVANGLNWFTLDVFADVPVTFGDVNVRFNFLVVDETPFEFVICTTTLECFRTCIDLETLIASIKINGQDLILHWNRMLTEDIPLKTIPIVKTSL